MINSACSSRDWLCRLGITFTVEALRESFHHIYCKNCMVKLYDDALQKFQEICNEYGMEFSFRMENFRLSSLPDTKWNGNLLTTIRMIQSVPFHPERPGTILTFIQSPTSEYWLENDSLQKLDLRVWAQPKHQLTNLGNFEFGAFRTRYHWFCWEFMRKWYLPKIGF